METKKELAREKVCDWGLMAVMNLYDCDPASISDPVSIKKFAVELCELIKMKRYGETLINRFGEGQLEGYSMMQFIETSSITAHFDEEKNRAFIDVFSCKHFNPEEALDFSSKFFKAKNSKLTVMERN